MDEEESEAALKFGPYKSTCQEAFEHADLYPNIEYLGQKLPTQVIIV